MLMPANPVSPFSAENVERYAPGGGSRVESGVGEDVVEEHAAISSAQAMAAAVEKIDPIR
jgi:hypothetical protein